MEVYVFLFMLFAVNFSLLVLYMYQSKQLSEMRSDLDSIKHELRRSKFYSAPEVFADEAP